MASGHDCGIFPEDLAREILVWCPVKSLLRFKCTCKNWYALIETPEFVQQHLNCSKNKLSQLLIYDHNEPDVDDYDYPSTLIFDNGVALPSHHSQRFKGVFEIIGSVNGLFCLIGEIDDVFSYTLWNPATREVRHLPAPEIRFHDFGFGIDPLTNDYKVVSFVYNVGEYAGVYSCCKDSWRMFKHKRFYEPPSHKDMWLTFGTTYLNGAYYWLVNGDGNCNLFLFDFESEMFDEIEGPDDDSVHNLALGVMVLDDSIAILNIVDRFTYDIWIMIQPGVWNKLVTFQCFPIDIKCCYDNCFILITKARRLISYNALTNKTRHLGFCLRDLSRDPHCLGFGFYCYKESLVTIKQRENGERI